MEASQPPCLDAPRNTASAGALDSERHAGVGFVAKLSHELRTPLTAILGYTELLLLHAKSHLPPAQFHYLEIIERSGHAMLRLIEAVLDWSRIEAGNVVCEPREFALRPTFEDFAETFYPMAIAKGLHMSLVIDSGLPGTFVTDPHRLRQIFTNLVGNAIKYTDQGAIVIEVAGNHRELVLCVSDTGPGIPRSEHEFVFREFHRVHPERKDGTGLGLAITRGLVELLGGRIKLDSEVGRGSRFEVALPRLQPTTPNQSTELELPFPRRRMPARILVVDDHADNRELIGRFLESEGYTAQICHGGLECLTQVLREPPDLVLMDLRMPEIDGFETTRRLRQVFGAAEIPIIGITALADRADQEKALVAGCNVCLSKPVDFRLLSHEIRRCLAEASHGPSSDA